MRPSSTTTRRVRRADGIAVGARLTFETLPPGTGTPAPARIAPGSDVLLRCVSGTARLAAGDERLLGPGDEAIVPAGVPYRLAGHDGEAVVVSGLRAR